MAELGLIMPMAGRGSRFERDGFAMPKPLIPLHGQPFFWWAVESLASKVALGEIVFVVLREHVERFGIDRQVLERYPHARIVALDEVTDGAAQTAALGVEAMAGQGPFAINDCDHAFDASGIETTLGRLRDGDADAALLGFRSGNPAFSYVRFDGQDRVVGTVEKQAISPFAIAGCYLFARPATFRDHYDAYRRACPYPELFVSGLYNTLLAAGGQVLFHELAHHVPFGTPAELQRVGAADLRFIRTPDHAS